MDISILRIFIRFSTLIFLGISIFTKEWFYLTNFKDSILIKIGVLKYCHENDCFSYSGKISNYFYIYKLYLY